MNYFGLLKLFGIILDHIESFWTILDFFLDHFNLFGATTVVFGSNTVVFWANTVVFWANAVYLRQILWYFCQIR